MIFSRHLSYVFFWNLLKGRGFPHRLPYSNTYMSPYTFLIGLCRHGLHDHFHIEVYTPYSYTILCICIPFKINRSPLQSLFILPYNPLLHFVKGDWILHTYCYRGIAFNGRRARSASQKNFLGGVLKTFLKIFFWIWKLVRQNFLALTFFPKNIFFGKWKKGRLASLAFRWKFFWKSFDLFR